MFYSLSDPRSDWRAHGGAQRPGWSSGTGRLFGACCATLDSDDVWDVGVISIPFDSTASSRVGCRYGPAAIREASLVYSNQADGRGDAPLTSMRTGATIRNKPRSCGDFGDGHVYPTSPEAQMRVTFAEAARVAQLSSKCVILGGEHLITYATFAAVRATAAAQGIRLGYVQIDHHFDCGRESKIHGSLYHGSNSRRLLELPGMSHKQVAFVGVGDFTPSAQLAELVGNGACIRSMRDIRSRSYSECLAEACESVLRHSDELYVSVDIDVCDTSVARGTGHVTMGGLTSGEWLDTAHTLMRYDVRALDIVEVNPLLDPSGATAHLAARLLYEWALTEPVACETLDGPQNIP